MAEATNLLKQAGGGVSKYTGPASSCVGKFEASVYDGLRHVFRLAAPEHKTFDEFLKYMTSEESNAMGPAADNGLTQPLPNYFISSSHNTYLTGHQLYGRANVDGYKNVLLRGCRSVEIDVWDGEPPSSESSSDEKNTQAARKANRVSKWRSTEVVEPVVLHGYTATKDVSFRRVCETIRDNAFVTSRLPVCVSLEVHACHEQQEIMVDIIKDTFGSMLVDANANDTAAVPSPGELLGKVLIKVKYSARKDPENELSEDLAKVHLAPSPSEDDPEQIQKAGKASKIIEALSELGTYIRGYSYKSLSHPDATKPHHIFSLSEGALSEVHKTDPRGLLQHNQHYLMRAYPRGTRISSSNLDPSPFWQAGVQMVALNWQRIDKGMMLNEGMFVDSGGWVLKPKGLRSDAACPSTTSCNAPISRLSVRIISGQNLPMPEDVEDLRPYVKCEVHLKIPNQWENSASSKDRKAGFFKTKTKPAKGIHPDFKNQLIEFEGFPALAPELGFLRLKVMHDKKLSGDDLAAWACIRLDRLRKGHRFVHLFDAKGAQSKGVILATFDFT